MYLLLPKVDTPFFRLGDYVRVLDDERSVRELQQGHGSWDVDMDQVGLHHTVAVNKNFKFRLRTTIVARCEHLRFAKWRENGIERNVERCHKTVRNVIRSVLHVTK